MKKQILLLVFQLVGIVAFSQTNLSMSSGLLKPMMLKSDNNQKFNAATFLNINVDRAIYKQFSAGIGLDVYNTDFSSLVPIGNNLEEFNSANTIFMSISPSILYTVNHHKNKLKFGLGWSANFRVQQKTSFLKREVAGDNILDQRDGLRKEENIFNHSLNFKAEYVFKMGLLVGYEFRYVFNSAAQYYYKDYALNFIKVGYQFRF